MTQIDSAAGSFYYQEAGSGPPLILIHGFPLTGDIWRAQLAGLAGKFRVIAPDLRGFGKSVSTEGGHSMDLYADDTVMLMDHLQIETAAVCGMSMGGYVLLNLLDRYPDRLSSACFMVTRGGGEDAEGKIRRTVLAEEVLNAGTTVVADAFSRILFAPGSAAKNPALVAQVHNMMMAASPSGLAGGLLAMRDRLDYSNRLAGFRVRSLVIGAADDMAIPCEESLKLAAGLNAAALCMIPEAGHMVMMEQPDAVNLALTRFLESV